MQTESKTAPQLATGGQILVRTLTAHGVRRVSTVAGESYLAVLDAFLDHPEIMVTTCRHEGGTAFMAESWGKLTGRPGICFVTRGPGACNASIGVHTAMQDSTPMILFMGQVPRHHKGREAFQEIDVRAVFGHLAKWATEIEDPARIPEIISRAFTVATSGRPGPVVIGLPEDMLREQTKLPADIDMPPPPMPQPTAAPDTFSHLSDILSGAKRPLAIVGGSGWSDRAIRDFQDFAGATHIPVAASFRRQDLFDHRASCYVGELGTGPNPALIKAVEQADLLLVVGARLNEICTQSYMVPPAQEPHQKLIHIHPSADELNKIYRTALPIQAAVNQAAAMLAGQGLRIDGRGWDGWRAQLRKNYTDWVNIDDHKQAKWNGADMTAIFAWLRDHLDKDAIITTDAGNFSGWAQRYLYYGRPGRLLAPISGAMGYAVPAAVGAALAEPERLVVGLCGDGGFAMTGQELATAMHHQAAPIIIVCNNNMYGTIRMHQERTYPGRISATTLTNPDFVKLAESYGVFGIRVRRADDFPTAFEQARKAGLPAIIEIMMDPSQMTTNSEAPQ